MGKRTTSVGIVATIAALGCGGGDNIAAPAAVECVITMSGAATTGTADCLGATTAWASATNKGAVIFSFSGAPTVTASIGFNGEPAVGTYTSAQTGAVTAIFVQSGANMWLAAVGDPNSPTQGSYTLTITSVANATTVAQGKSYTTHGTLTATVPAVGGAGSGTVSIQMTF
jgi:hypothetical protein